jgi:hypothetical protein
MHEGPDRLDYQILREAVEVWRVALAGVMLQKAPDWFVTSAMIGHPAPWTARRLVMELGNLSDALLLNETHKARTTLVQLFRTAIRDRLARFQRCTRSKEPRPYEVEGNWVYLLRSAHEWGVVNLGTIVGHLEEAVVEMDDLNPDLAPYGVSGAWRVTDVEAGYRLAAHVLRNALVATDFYEFEKLADVEGMKDSITRALANRDLLEDNVPPREPTLPSAARAVLTNDLDDVEAPSVGFKP